MGKGATLIASGMSERDERKLTSDNASKPLCDIETGAVPLLQEERGGNLPTGHVVSGV